MARVSTGWYVRPGTLLETSSSAIDEQAALEKMAVALMAAVQGARDFSGLGSLCVDDLFSGVQFVIDVEMVSYLREMIEAFNPHPDLLSIDDSLYDLLREVCLGKEAFISHIHTASKFRHIMPSSNRLVREKLRSWMQHRMTLKDRAGEECRQRIRDFQPQFHLDDDRHRALDEIYARAKKALLNLA
ncbi:MAG TPA: trimethylamine methyltransferase family protein [Armatimonadota bacterium]|nr:trimethylamine methyltransferase family protein [Armatimonadota bacterium]